MGFQHDDYGKRLRQLFQCPEPYDRRRFRLNHDTADPERLRSRNRHSISVRHPGKELGTWAGGGFARFLLHLLPSDDKVIVFAIIPPRTWRHVAHVHKLPVRYVSWRESQVITNCRRNAQARAMSRVWLGPLILKNILKVISEK